jgi:hypothetical protein
MAALIISVLALIIGLASLTWQLAKQLSTHKIQMVPVDPLQGWGQMGKPMVDEFKELGDDIDQEELERLALIRAKKGKMT